jgi:protein-arginine kinase activator protein McsA
MAKAGLIHDYDLMANREQSAQGVTCAICDTPNTSFQWSDYNGEGMCTVCGCTYQLINGSDKMKAEGKYPYMTLNDKYLPVLREFWQQTRTWVHYGSSFQRHDGKAELNDWIKQKHPELLTEQS